MTDTERYILRRDEEQQSLLSSELASRSSFIGAIATLAAFLVLQWGQSTNWRVVPVVLYLAVGVSFALLLLASKGQVYLMPAVPALWSAWLKDRMSELHEVKYPDADAEAEIDLRDSMFADIARRAPLNRGANKHKAALLNCSGTISVGVVLAVLTLSIGTKLGLF